MNILMESTYSRIVQTKYGPMMFFKNDDPIGSCLGLYGEWAEQEFDAISKLVNATSNTIDIGANIGTHSVWLSRHCNKGYHICIEPQFYIFNFLTTNLMLNDAINCFPIKAFVGQETKSIQAEVLGPEKHRVNYGEFNNKNVAEDNGVSTDIIRLDDIQLLNRFNIDFIKMDCEGTEREVLLSGHNILTNNKPHMYLEYNGVLGNPAVLEVLDEYNYNYYWHVYPKFNVKNHNRYNLNIYLREDQQNVQPTVKNASILFESNIICIHKDKDEGIFNDKLQDRDDTIIKWLLRNHWIVP